MLSRRSGIFPARPVRDALGLARLLYAVEPDPARRALLARVGTDLAHALTLSRYEVDSMGWRAAFGRAEEAVERLAGMGWPAGVVEIVEEAGRRVRGEAVRPASLPEAGTGS